MKRMSLDVDSISITENESTIKQSERVVTDSLIKRVFAHFV